MERAEAEAREAAVVAERAIAGERAAREECALRVRQAEARSVHAEHHAEQAHAWDPDTEDALAAEAAE